MKAPDVVGLSYEDAKGAYQKAVNSAPHGARLSLDTEKQYSTRPPGTVLAVKPAAFSHKGSRIPSGTTLHLTIARAIPEVPNVVNEGVKKATRDLRSRGYEVRTRRRSADAAKGLVLAQSVPAGHRLVPGRGAIVLTIAKPPSGYYVTVLGSGSALVTWGTIDGTHQMTAGLPFSTKVNAGGSFNVISLVAQRQSGDSGSITCEIVFSGRIVKKSTSSGAYAVCSVNASA